MANGNSNIIPLHRGIATAAARPVREQGRPPSSAPVLSPVPVEQLRAMFAERSFAERFDGPPRNVEVSSEPQKYEYRFLLIGALAALSWVGVYVLVRWWFA